jgi:protein SCO1
MGWMTEGAGAKSPAERGAEDAAARREQAFALGGIAFIVIVTAGWWALALWPVSASAPEWFLRTRLVCFGADGNGLPDFAGWVGLIGQPAGLVGILLAGWGGAVRRGLAGIRAGAFGRSGLYAYRAFVLVAIAGVMAAAHRVGTARVFMIEAALAAESVSSSYPRLDRDAPALELVGHHGERVGLEQFRGRPVLLTFAYAHCATICPLLVKDVQGAQALLAEEGREVPAGLVVTLDPWRDTPARLPHIATSWGLGADALLLGGAVPEVEAVLDAWDVPRLRDERTGEVGHPALVYVIDAEGRIAYAAVGGAAALAELVRRL